MDAEIAAKDPTEPGIHSQQIEALEERLAAGQRLLSSILESVPAAIAYLDKNLIYRHCNQAAAAEMGQPVEAVLGRHLHDLHPDNPQVWEAFDGVLRTGQPFRSEEFPIRWRHRPEEGTQYYIVAYLPDIDAAGLVQGVFAESQRVTALVEARLRLQEASDQLEERVATRTAALSRANAELRYQASILANVGDAVFTTDQRRRIRYLNPAAERQSGWRAEEALGHEILHLTRVEFLSQAREDVAAAVKTAGRWEGEVLLYRKDGTPFLADAKVETLRDENGRFLGFVGIVRDIAERKRLEAALRAEQEQAQAFSRHLVASIEEERRKLARELHDQAGQYVYALSLNLDRLRRDVANGGQQAERFEAIDQIVDGLANELRRLALNLRPINLDRSGLIAALQQQVEACRSQSGLDVTFEALNIDDQRLTDEVKTTLYRVVQEALTNALRHAHAQHVRVVLQRYDTRVVASVKDDGRGFDVAEALSRDRLGLLGMRERAGMLAGRLTIDSAPGHGTTVSIDLPSGDS